MKKENFELNQHKNCCYSSNNINNIMNTQLTLNPNEEEINNDCELKAEQL